MSTLSVKTYTVAGGRTPSLVCGPNFNCPDPRDDFYLQNIVGKTMESISFSGDGCRYSLYKINGGRGDASEACVFIPKNIIAAQSPLMQIVPILKNLINSGSTSESTKLEIERMCAVQCPEMRNSIPSFGLQTAALYYGENVGLSLEQILSDVFRPEFDGFKTIFLSDNPEIKYSAQEIPGCLLFQRNMVVVRRPYSDEKGFIPTINGEPFIQDQYMHNGTPFIVEWSKKYWHPITKHLIASERLNSQDFRPNPKEYKRTKNNPLYTIIIIVIVVMIGGVLSLLISNIIKTNKNKEIQEAELQSKIEHLNFDVNFAEYKDIDNKDAWENAIQKASKLDTTYGFKVWKNKNAYAPEDIEAFCKVVEAAKYLDNHTIWDKQEMEKLDSLKGFYDFVNSYDIVLARKKGTIYVDRFKNIANVKNLLSLTPKPGLTGLCTTSGQINLIEYKEKVEFVPQPTNVQRQSVVMSKTDKERKTTNIDRIQNIENI